MLFIFRGQRLREDLLMNGPDGCRGTATQNAFIDTKVFKDWIGHFVQNIPPARPVLLILDNLRVHTALEVLEECKENGIEVLALPPHTTHILQPLDAGFFRSFKSEWRTIVNDWSEATDACCVEKHIIAPMVRQAMDAAWSDEVKTKSWKSTGLWPVNPEKTLLKTVVSKDSAPTSLCASFMLTDVPIPLGNIKPRHILQLKRQGIDLHEYRSFSITQRRLNSISPAKRMQDPMYIDLKSKRLLTHDECMAARRLKQNELDDQKREKEEKRKAAALKGGAKFKEKEAKRIEKLVKSRLRALETERKKIEVQAKKADKEQQKRKAQVSKKVTASAEKQNAATARPTKAKSKKIATLNQPINFNLSHMVTTSEGQNTSTTYPTDEPLLPTDRQRPHLVTNAVPGSVFMNPAAQQPIVYFADL